MLSLEMHLQLYFKHHVPMVNPASPLTCTVESATGMMLLGQLNGLAIDVTMR
ncbi:hypothetical protein BH20ACI3_BH20ACI3_37150 [soil metagenome]